MDSADEYRASVSCLIPEELKHDLMAITELVQTVAQRYPGDVIALLTLLRTLEASHREVCDTLFQESLPKNRQQLYSLLREMEAEGGWPYIPRMKLRSLLTQLDPLTKQDLGLNPTQNLEFESMQNFGLESTEFNEV